MRLFLLALVVLGFTNIVQASEPLPTDDAFRLSAKQGNDGITFNWNIADGYYLYRNHIAARQNETPLKIYSDPGVEKDDPNFGLTEIYYSFATASVTSSKSGPITLEYQGCQEEGICYPLETRLVDPVSLEITKAVPSNSFSNFSYKPSTLTTQAVEEAKPEASITTAIEVTKEKGLVQSLLDDGNEAFVIFSFLLFGILLALTPCVFPMYPIMASALAREGEKLTPRRGLVLSSIYVVSLASAFALIGAVAGYSGQNLQMVLQSPYTAGVVAAIFGVLALSMFGLFELQLSSRWTSAIQSKTNGTRGGKRSAAILGFSSVLLVGPCVTAPLAGALLFIAQTANVALGAASLFALGIGKGIPLIIVSTIGGSILPRAGAWMENVKRVFGFAFIGSAIWMAAPLLPVGIDLLLWAILALAVAAFLLSESWRSLNGKIAARAIGAAALVYGATLIVGFASGGTDPMKPLDRLGGGAPADLAVLQFAESTSTEDLSAKLQKANKPSLVYFTAEWCTSCHTIERRVLTDNAVKSALNGFQLIKVDLTHLSDDKKAMMRDLNVVGPPTMLFFDASGKERLGTRLVGDVTAKTIIGSAAQ